MEKDIKQIGNAIVTLSLEELRELQVYLETTYSVEIIVRIPKEWGDITTGS